MSSRRCRETWRSVTTLILLLLLLFPRNVIWKRSKKTPLSRNGGCVTLGKWLNVLEPRRCVPFSVVASRDLQSTSSGTTMTTFSNLSHLYFSLRSRPNTFYPIFEKSLALVQTYIFKDIKISFNTKKRI